MLLRHIPDMQKYKNTYQNIDELSDDTAYVLLSCHKPFETYVKSLIYVRNQKLFRGQQNDVP